MCLGGRFELTGFACRRSLTAASGRRAPLRPGHHDWTRSHELARVPPARHRFVMAVTRAARLAGRAATSLSASARQDGRAKLLPRRPYPSVGNVSRASQPEAAPGHHAEVARAVSPNAARQEAIAE